MKKLVLTQEESNELKEKGAIEITRNGFDILIEELQDWEKWDEENNYKITIVNPYEKILLK